MKPLLQISLFLFFSSLISITNQQYIATSDDYEKVTTSLLDDYQKVFDNSLSDSLKKLLFKRIQKDNVIIKDIFPISSSANVDDSYVDLISNFFIISPLKISITFRFDYKIGETEIKKGELEVGIFDLRFQIETFDGTFQFLTFESEYRQKDFLVHTSTDQLILQSAFFGAVEMFKETIGKALSGNILSCYSSKLLKKKPFNFTPSLIFGERAMTINLNQFVSYCEDRGLDYKGAICYYSGNVSEKVNRNVKTEALKEPSFKVFSGSKKLFVNYKLITEIFEKLNKDKEIVFVLDSNSPIAKDLPFKFNVESLRHICTEDILKPYKDEDTYTVTTKLKELVLLSNEVTIKMSSSINIKDQQEVITFEYGLKSSQTFHLDNSLPKFNICLNKNIDPFDLAVKTEKAIRDSSLLLTWLSRTFVCVRAYQICLSNDSINLRDYFKGPLTNLMMTKYGMYLEGNSLY